MFIEKWDVVAMWSFKTSKKMFCVFSCFGQTEAILTILDSNSDISVSNIVNVSHYLEIQLDLIRSEKFVKRICIEKRG